MPNSSTIPTSGRTQATQTLYNNVVKDALRIVQVAGSAKTISTGAITVSPASGEGFYSVDTQSAAAQDDLDTISGGATGDVITLVSANSARLVTLKHNTGNIQMPGGVDVNLSTVFGLMLQYNGTNWIPVGGVNTKINQEIQISAGSLTPANTNGADAPLPIEMSTNKNMLVAMGFTDSGGYKYAHITFRLPSDYDGGKVTCEFDWTANSTSTNTAVWGAQAVAKTDDGALDVAFGTEQVIADANKATAYDLNQTAKTPEITIAGTPAAGKLVEFRFFRNSGHASDNLAVTAYLLNVKINYGRA